MARMMRVALLLLIVIACSTQQPRNGTVHDEPSGGASMTTIENVTLKTSDGMRIVGTYYPADAITSIILLHQYRLDRTSWHAFAEQLQAQGFPVLAIDLRGHGESEGKYAAFSDADFQKMTLDAIAAEYFLEAKGKHVIAIMGASIGANTALRYSADNRVPAVLLSPGLVYHGIDINNVTSTAPTLIIAAIDDAYSASSSRELDANNLFGHHELLIVEGAAHGTFLLADPAVTEKVLAFVKQIGVQENSS